MIKKISVLSFLIVFYIASVASLSCVIPPEKFTFHCPEQGVCEKNVSLQEIETGYLDVEQISPDNTTNLTVEESFERKYLVKKVENRELPSAEKAREKSQSVCPAQRNFHMYPKNSFEKGQLQDTEKCYKTKIEETENYYKVTREGTTEPLTCRRVKNDSFITGGDTSWVEKITLEELIIEKLILNLLL